MLENQNITNQAVTGQEIPVPNYNESVTMGNSSKKTRIILSIIFAAIFAGAVSYYAVDQGLFSKAPYAQDNLISGLAYKMSKIENSTNSLELSFHTEERGEGRLPYVESELNIKNKEIYARDADRFEIVKMVFNYFDNKGLAAKDLNTVLTDSDIVIYNQYSSRNEIDLNDPSLMDSLKYSTSNNGQDFEIVVYFQSSDFVNDFKNELERYSNYSWRMSESETQPQISGNQITFKRGDYFSTYFNTRANKTLYEEINDMLEYVPVDINLKSNFEAAMNLDVDNGVYNFDVKIEALADLGDMIYTINLNLLKVKENIYVKINNFPSLLMMYMPIPKGEWISIGEEFKKEMGYVLDAEEQGLLSAEYQKAYAEFMEELISLADQNSLLLIQGEPKKTDFDGSKVYKYDTKINFGNLESFLNDVIDFVNNSESQFDDEFAYLAEMMLDEIKNEGFADVMEYFINNTDISILVDSKGYPVMFETKLYLIPDVPRLSNKQFVFNSKLVFKNINKKTEIQEPTNYKKLEDIMDDMNYRDSLIDF